MRGMGIGQLLSRVVLGVVGLYVLHVLLTHLGLLGNLQQVIAKQRIRPTQLLQPTSSLDAEALLSSGGTVHSSFPRYSPDLTNVPAWVVRLSNPIPRTTTTTTTNGKTSPSYRTLYRSTLHRFFDSSPFSPSGRFLAVTRIPAPQPSQILKGRNAEVILVDLHKGTQRLVAHTGAWGAQLGAQLQWGKSDDELFFNQIPIGRGVRGFSYNATSRVSRMLGCPIYHVSHDGRRAASPNLYRIKHTQFGYGVDYSRRGNVSAVSAVQGQVTYTSKQDGLFVTDLTTGRCSLLVSLHAFCLVAGLDTVSTPTYGFHTKWSHDGSKIMFVMRTMERARGMKGAFGHLVRRQHLFVVGVEGAAVRHIISWSSKDYASSSKGSDADADGNHPSWVPSTNLISMNLRNQSGSWQLVTIDTEPILSAPAHKNSKAAFKPVYQASSGHPNFSPGGRYVLLDVYAKERYKFALFAASRTNSSSAADAGTVDSQSGKSAPLRLVDTKAGKEVWLMSLQLMPDAAPSSQAGSTGEPEGAKAGAVQNRPDVTGMPFPLVAKEARAWRCDAHPAWSRDHRWVALTARPYGLGREVIIAYVGSDLSKFFE